MENCVIESNNSYSMEIYDHADNSFFNRFNFKAVWFENNCYQSNDRYSLYSHADSGLQGTSLVNVRFEQCSFTAKKDTQPPTSIIESCINVQGSQFVTFDECAFYCSDPDRDIVLDASAHDTYFKNRSGLPADITTRGTNTVVDNI
jgi:hypothetical protein